MKNEVSESSEGGERTQRASDGGTALIGRQHVGVDRGQPAPCFTRTCGHRQPGRGELHPKAFKDALGL